MNKILILRFLSVGILVLGLLMLVSSLAMASAPQPVEADTELWGEAAARPVAQDDEVDCVRCHKRDTPGIVEQFERSDHAAEEVVCEDCHVVEEDYPGAVQHPDEEFFVLPRSSTARCQDCHDDQVEGFYMSRHALPAYVAYAGTEPLNEEMLSMYQSIP